MTAEPLGSALEPLGINSDGERVYRFVLASGPSPVSAIAERVNMDIESVHALLEQLRDQGLLARRVGEHGEYAPVDPRYALRAAVNRLGEEITRIHDEVPSLAAQFDVGMVATAQSAATQVLTDPDAIAGWYSRLQHEVRSEFLAFDRPPYVTASMDPLEPLSISRGVQWKAVYASTSFDIDGTWEEVQQLARHGEQSRVYPNLPLKLAIVDRRVALISLNHEPGKIDALITRDLPLVNALTELFHTYWERALEVSPSTGGAAHRPRTARDATDEERALLSLIGAGLKDESIARQLGISARTVRRRTQDLFTALGASNRFQAGVEAARRGWV